MNNKKELSELVDSTHFVKFDLDGSGQKKWSWIKPEAGLLVYLGSNKSAVVNSGRELFGNISFWIFWKNGYEVMRSLDDNSDESLTGSELNGIFIWQDLDQNGICERKEIHTLKSQNIKSLFTNYKKHSTGIEFNEFGVEFENGSFAPSYDWISHSE